MRANGKNTVTLLAVLLSLSAWGSLSSPAYADEHEHPPSSPSAAERVDLRTSSSRTYELPDGRMLTQLFERPIFYRSGGSSWQPIDTTLHSRRDGSGLEADRSPSALSLEAADSADGFMRLDGGGHTISIGLPEDTPSGRAGTMPESREDGLYAEYLDFLPGGISLRVFPHTDGQKMFLVLNSRPSRTEFSFTLDAPGLRLGPDPLGTPGALALTDSAGTVVAKMPRPFMQDSSYLEGRGGGLYSEAVTMTYSGGVGHWLLRLSIDPAFLESATYPVYVDPSVTSFPTATTTAEDTFASSKYPGSNFDDYQRPDSPEHHELWHGNEPGTSYYNQAFIWFKTMASVLGSAHVTDARLRVYPYWQYNHSDPKTTWIERVTTDWSAGSVTWNQRPTSVDYGQGDTSQGDWSDFNVTTFVQNVLSGIWTNYGLMLHADSLGQGGWKRFVSLQDVDLDLLPHLEVTWYLPQAIALGPEDAGETDTGELNWVFDDGDGDTDIGESTQTKFQAQVATTQAFGASVIADSGVVSSAIGLGQSRPVSPSTTPPPTTGASKSRMRQPGPRGPTAPFRGATPSLVNQPASTLMTIQS